jgi:hypothetical protein
MSGIFTVADGVLLKGTWIVIPTSSSDVLKKLHAGHQGIVKYQERVKSMFGGLAWAAKSERWSKTAESAAKKTVTQLSSYSHLCFQDGTTIAADASSFGLGAVLLQRQEYGQLQDRPVAFASTSM